MTSLKAPSKGEQTRERILDAALLIASREGLEGLTIGGIAERLDMSKSGVFAHFGSREDLQIAVIDDYARRFLDAVFFPALKKPRGLPRLKAMFENWLDRIVFVEIPNGCVFVSGAVEFDDKEGPVRDRMVAVNRGWQGEMRAAALQAIEAGHLGADTDPDQLVFDLYGVMLSLHHDARLLRDARAVERARLSFRRTINFYAGAVNAGAVVDVTADVTRARKVSARKEGKAAVRLAA
jgi:AcrR family transcriptional regulator